MIMFSNLQLKKNLIDSIRRLINSYIFEFN